MTYPFYQCKNKRLLGLLAPIRLAVGVSGVNDGMGARTGFPVGFTLQAKFHSVGGQNLFVGIIAPGSSFPAAGCDGVVGGKGHGARFFLLAIRVGKVDVFPVAHQFVFRNGYLGYSPVAFGHHHRPSAFSPPYGAYMPHHEGVAVRISCHIFCSMWSGSSLTDVSSCTSRQTARLRSSCS